ncbi:MAG: hypothetical protein P1U86_19560 [Verrucomicrobiales bacterium]|nr:hypothetical protein [Verrucomicrobiales bacterium]
MTRTAFLQTLLSGGPGIVFGASPGPDQSGLQRFIPGPSRGRFRDWKQRAMVPVIGSRNPLISAIEEAASGGGALRIRYRGGSEPGLDREISPAFVFTRPQFSDLSEWYQNRYGVEEGRGTGAITGSEDDWQDLSRFLESRCPVYVLAWCHQRNSQRFFRVSRMDLG